MSSSIGSTGGSGDWARAARRSASFAPQASRTGRADSGDRERSIRSFVNTESGDHEHLLAWA
jgi:hypothetical protein